jgi:hypothetical protein
MADEKIEGGCQCGAVRYQISGEPLMAAICHCSMCRRANAAPAVAWAMYNESQVIFVKDPPKLFSSSAEAKRGFCSNCGTQISFTAEFIPGLIDIAIGSFDHPEKITPMFHYWNSKRLPWIQFADDLPKFPEFPPTE